MISEIRTAFCLVTTAASQGEKGQSENDASPMMLSLSKKKKKWSHNRTILSSCKCPLVLTMALIK